MGSQNGTVNATATTTSPTGPTSATMPKQTLTVPVAPTLVPVNCVPVNSVALTSLPEHTQRLMALGLYSARPYAPKYTIAIIPTPQKKRRRKRRGKRRRKRKTQVGAEKMNAGNQDSSVSSDEDMKKLGGCVDKIDCLNIDQNGNDE